MPRNDANFLMWFNANESQFDAPIARPFLREPEQISPVVWLVPGEEMRFYFNSLDNANGPDSQITLFHQPSGVSYIPPQTIHTIGFPDGFHSYGSLSLSFELPEGLVYLKWGQMRTQWLYFTTLAKAKQFTNVLVFHNEGRRLQNFRYAYVPDDWSQQFRVRMSIDSESPSQNKEIYKESVTGKPRGYYSESDWVVNIETSECDRWMHRAFTTLIDHDYIEINGQQYAYESAYQANIVKDNPFSSGKFGLLDVTYSTLNRS